MSRVGTTEVLDHEKEEYKLRLVMISRKRRKIFYVFHVVCGLHYDAVSRASVQKPSDSPECWSMDTTRS